MRVLAVLAFAGLGAGQAGAVVTRMFTMGAPGGGLIGPGSAAGVCEAFAQAKGGAEPGWVAPYQGQYKSDGCHFVDGAGDRGTYGMNEVDSYNTHTCDPAGTFHPDDGNRYTWAGIAAHRPDYCNNGCSETANQIVNGPDGFGSYATGAGTSKGTPCGLNAAAQAGPSGLPPDPNSDTASPQSGAPTQCTGAAACSGTVNGATVCVACGTPTTTSTSVSTTKNADGSTSSSTTTSVYQPNPDGSFTDTKTTTGSGGSSTTTTSTGFPGTGGIPSALSGGSNGGGGVGAGGGQCTGTDCGSDSFGGSCLVPFTCDGDAVQCAIAMEQHQRDCLFYQPETQTGLWADGAKTLTTAIQDGDVPSWSPSHPSQVSASTVDWGTTIDQSHVIASNCPADQTFAVGSTQVAIPLSALCPYFGTLGNFIVAMTTVACAFILFKGGK